MFTFANCLILIFLFDATSSKTTEIRHQNPSNFWQNLMQKNEIWDEQMAVEMDESDSFIEKLSKEETYKKPLSPNEFPGLFFNLFKLDNFYELVKGQGEVAKLVQDLAKTFINIKSSLIKISKIEKNDQIEITTILDKTENAMKFLAKQYGINYKKAGKSTAVQIELPVIVKRMATIWSEMRRINNDKNANEIVQQIVYLWQSVKQNDEFNEYFGNKSEGKNRRTKRRTYGHGPSTPERLLIGVGIIVVLLIIIWILYRCGKKN